MKPGIGNDRFIGGSEAFFEHWAIYRKIIAFNYMDHNQIAEVIARYLSPRIDLESVLDLGCGDAELPSRYLSGLNLREYHGVDLAAEPLEFAREKLADMPGTTHFHHADQATFLAELERPFNLIVLGFALHHNTLPEKARLVADATRNLTETGVLLVYDVFREPEETREAFFNRYLNWIGCTWMKMTDREHRLIDSHIRENDYPDTEADLRQCAQQAGLGSGENLLSTCADFHRLLAFRRA